jgi:hypothetical protein
VAQQTKRKRKTKHRGNAAGIVESRGRTGRQPTASEKNKLTREDARNARLNRRPTWKGSITKAGLATIIMFAVLLLIGKDKNRAASASILALLIFAFYTPGAYYLETSMWKKRMKKQGLPTTAKR